MWPPQQVATKASSCLFCSLLSGCLVMIYMGQYCGQNRGRLGPPTEGVSGEFCHAMHFSLPWLNAFLFLEKPDGPDFSVSYIKYATYVLQFLSLYSSEMLKHQPSTLTNSTWTFSSCFCLKQSKNILVKKIYDNSSIFSPFYMSAKFHFLNTIEKATGGITVSKNVNFSVKTRPFKSC